MDAFILRALQVGKENLGVPIPLANDAGQNRNAG
jgi:hypothetical protein